MTHQEKNIVASIAVTIVVFGTYFLWVTGAWQDGRLDGADGTVLIGKSILLLIAATIVANIVATILFSIVFAIAENEPRPSFVVDERDRLIELRGLRLSSYITGAGFVLSMGALALGQPVIPALIMIICAFALGDLIGNCLKLCIYRRGF